MPARITSLTVRDIRFPTSRQQDGSDALNQGDYSATYVTLQTDDPSDLSGDGITFTNGRGNEIVVCAVEALKRHVVGRDLEEIIGDMRGLYRDLTTDNQLRWLGPEKGVIHLATAAILNAVWDLWAKRDGKPLWKLLAGMEPQKLVSCIDFSYITDAITPGEAVDILTRKRATRPKREAELLRNGYPAYTTSTGWLGYSDEKVCRLCEQAVAAGWTHFKMKVGPDLEANRRRAALMRRSIGLDHVLMMDANQCWDVDEAIRQMNRLAEFRPLWIEEPTSPDDVLGHAQIAQAVRPLGIGVATGEACQNRVIFKQLFQANAIQFCQVDTCRMGGVNEWLAVVLMAAKFGVPVCPHAGGVGLCEYAQHVSVFDYVAVSGSLDGRILEYVDHLHEHFIDPVRVAAGRYIVPTSPGYSISMKPQSLAEFEYPHGAAWEGI
jgi:L-fuconate dehydratase